MNAPSPNRPSSSGEAITERERLVLTSVVLKYIANGGPVSSQAVAHLQNRDGLGPATVRNIMADLEEAGYLDQPHTSAGRVPTVRAFRLYVEQLLQSVAPATHLLPQAAQEQIAGQLDGALTPAQFLATSSHLLAALTGGVGVVLTMTGQHGLLEHIHFTRLSHRKVMAVLVTTTGQVQERLLMLDHDLSTLELEAAARYLDNNFHGWDLEQARKELARRMELDRTEYDRQLRALDHLYQKGVLTPAPLEETVFVDGASNLITSEADRARLRQVLAALEEKQRVIGLLQAYLEGNSGPVRVIVGLGDAMPEMQDMTLVAAPAHWGGGGAGAVAVLGPVRMHYEQAIGGVSYVASLFEKMLQAP